MDLYVSVAGARRIFVTHPSHHKAPRLPAPNPQCNSAPMDRTSRYEPLRTVVGPEPVHVATGLGRSSDTGRQAQDGDGRSRPTPVSASSRPGCSPRTTQASTEPGRALYGAQPRASDGTGKSPARNRHL